MINQKVQGPGIQTKVTTTMQTCLRVHEQVMKKVNPNFIKKEKTKACSRYAGISGKKAGSQSK